MQRPPTYELLEQDEIWIPGDGYPQLIDDMDDQHLVNLKGWLFRNAQKIHSQMILDMYRFAGTLNGEMALDVMDWAIAKAESQDPLLWIEERPLFQAINRIISERRNVVWKCTVVSPRPSSSTPASHRPGNG